MSVVGLLICGRNRDFSAANPLMLPMQLSTIRLSRSRTRSRLLPALLVVALLLNPAETLKSQEPESSSPSVQQAQTANPVLFETAIQQIFKAKCLKCHNPRMQKAELDLSSRSGILKGSEAGEILDLETPAESLLLEMISEELMPPEDEPQLTVEEIASIKAWVTGGAKFAAPSPVKQQSIDQHSVLPILHLRCTVCHGNRP